MPPANTRPRWRYVGWGHQILVYGIYSSLFVMGLTVIIGVSLLAISPPTEFQNPSENDLSVGDVIQAFADAPPLPAPPGPSLSDRYAGLVVKAFAAGTAAFALCTLLLSFLYGRRVRAPHSEN